MKIIKLIFNIVSSIVLTIFCITFIIYTHQSSLDTKFKTTLREDTIISLIESKYASDFQDEGSISKSIFSYTVERKSEKTFIYTIYYTRYDKYNSKIDDYAYAHQYKVKFTNSTILLEKIS